LKGRRSQLHQGQSKEHKAGTEDMKLGNKSDLQALFTWKLLGKGIRLAKKA